MATKALVRKVVLDFVSEMMDIPKNEITSYTRVDTGIVLALFASTSLVCHRYNRTYSETDPPLTVDEVIERIWFELDDNGDIDKLSKHLKPWLASKRQGII